MSRYRIYVLNAQERIARSWEVDCLADGDALVRAETARAGHYAAEVWTGGRLVERLGGEFSLAEAWGAEPTGQQIISGC